jgi:hypothetical protein
VEYASPPRHLATLGGNTWLRLWGKLSPRPGHTIVPPLAPPKVTARLRPLAVPWTVEIEVRSVGRVMLGMAEGKCMFSVRRSAITEQRV